MIAAAYLFGTLVGAQTLPPPPSDDGTCIVVYESGELGIYRAVGVDLQTQSILFGEQVHEQTILTTPTGETFRTREGESGFWPVSRDQAYSLESATQQFPFLIPAALAKVDPDRIESSRTPDGGWDINARLVMGDLNLTVLDYAPPGGPKDVIVRYIFDETGRLSSMQREGGEIQVIEYADADHPELAPSLPRNHDKSGGMRVVSVETYIPGRPDLFEPEAVLPRIQELTRKHAEAERKLVEATLATDKGRQEMRESQKPDDGILGWRSNRTALILAGLVVVGIGGFAWWRNR